MTRAKFIREHLTPATTAAYTAHHCLVAFEHGIGKVCVGGHRIANNRAPRTADRLEF